MRYSQDHKAQTHQRIIKEASVRFRRDRLTALDEGTEPDAWWVLCALQIQG